MVKTPMLEGRNTAPPGMQIPYLCLLYAVVGAGCLPSTVLPYADFVQYMHWRIPTTDRMTIHIRLSGTLLIFHFWVSVTTLTH